MGRIKDKNQVMSDKRRKKIGIFDSGLGGLYVARAIQRMLPEYDLFIWVIP